jgi:hypothetical protein
VLVLGTKSAGMLSLSEIEGARAPSPSQFYTSMPAPVAPAIDSDSDSESDLEPSLEPKRGRKRRRSSAAPLPAKQMSNLRGRGRNRSLSSKDDEVEGKNGSSESEEDIDDDEQMAVAAGIPVLAAMTVYVQHHHTTPEIKSAMSNLEKAVSASAPHVYPDSTQAASEGVETSENESTAIGAGISFLNAMTDFLENSPGKEGMDELSAALEQLGRVVKDAVAKKSSKATRTVLSNPLRYPGNSGVVERPVVKKRRSQSPSRSRSAGEGTGGSPQPRRRQRTRSRSRNHVLGRSIVT